MQMKNFIRLITVTVILHNYQSFLEGVINNWLFKRGSQVNIVNAYSSFLHIQFLSFFSSSCFQSPHRFQLSTKRGLPISLTYSMLLSILPLTCSCIVILIRLYRETYNKWLRKQIFFFTGFAITRDWCSCVRAFALTNSICITTLYALLFPSPREKG